MSPTYEAIHARDVKRASTIRWNNGQTNYVREVYSSDDQTMMFLDHDIKPIEIPGGTLVDVQVDEKEATIAVAVTIKLTARGTSPADLISDATSQAFDIVTEAFEYLPTEKKLRYMPTVQGATALVNKRSVGAMFS